MVENDIALLELDEEVDLRHYTPVCLPRKDEADQVGRALALGWGGDGTEWGTNDKLNSVEVRDLRVLLNQDNIPNGQFLGNDIREDHKGICGVCLHSASFELSSKNPCRATPEVPSPTK